MTNVNRLPLSQFDSRFRELLQRGCKEVVEIPCRDRAAALHLRNLITTYRAKLRKEHADNRAAWEPLYGTIVSTKRYHENVVTLRPRLEEFGKELDRLGLERPQAELEVDPLEAILSEIEKPSEDKT